MLMKISRLWRGRKLKANKRKKETVKPVNHAAAPVTVEKKENQSSATTSTGALTLRSVSSTLATITSSTATIGYQSTAATSTLCDCCTRQSGKSTSSEEPELIKSRKSPRVQNKKLLCLVYILISYKRRCENNHSVAKWIQSTSYSTGKRNSYHAKDIMYDPLDEMWGAIVL